jgi:hypothetical protein
VRGDRGAGPRRSRYGRRTPPISRTGA